MAYTFDFLVDLSIALILYSTEAMNSLLLIEMLSGSP